jgi:hypothetical protein
MSPMVKKAYSAEFKADAVAVGRRRKFFSVPDHGLLHGTDQVAPQVPSVGDLYRIRRPDPTVSA